MADNSNRDVVISLIKYIKSQLPKWRKWFPNEDSEVEISRRDLMLLIQFADIGLQSDAQSIKPLEMPTI